MRDSERVFNQKALGNMHGSPELLGDNLTLVGRQLLTAGGHLDLLGVDQDGRLVVFELKKGVLTRDALAEQTPNGLNTSITTLDYDDQFQVRIGIPDDDYAGGGYW